VDFREFINGLPILDKITSREDIVRQLLQDWANKCGMDFAIETESVEAMADILEDSTKIRIPPPVSICVDALLNFVWEHNKGKEAGLLFAMRTAFILGFVSNDHMEKSETSK
jgi:hypothetical protein